MKLTLQLKLLPDHEQAKALLDTMTAFNAAANYAAEQAFAARMFSKPSIQKLVYYELRSRFGLSAQLAVRAIGKACEAFARDKTKCPIFREDGAITYDERILSFKDCHKVSILTVEAGRLLVPYVFGECQAANLHRIRGQADLVYRDGNFLLYCTIAFKEPPPVEVHDFLGVDLGIVNLAVDSDGNTYSGEKVEKVRRRFAKTRRNLQRRATKSARRILKRIRRRESRFRRHENHGIAKRIVATAKDTGRGIALEDLTHIRLRTTVRRRQRARHHGWAFGQLRAFISYKAQRHGIPVHIGDARYTSRTCSACGCCDKRNRPSQSVFRCGQCGFTLNADLNAARNHRSRARGTCKLPSSAAVPQN
jgi:IS605 OrfB family transposase